MIKTPRLNEALQERPSKTRLKMYTIGDIVKLAIQDVEFDVKVLFRRGEDGVGVVSEQWLSQTGLMPGDLVAFENGNIISITIDESRERLMTFMLLTHNNTEDKYILHTRTPRMIAQVVLGAKIEAKPAVWIEDPVDFNKEVPVLMKAMTDWYFYSYVNKRS